MDITQALHQLDPKNDDHWTAEGLPRIDALVAILGCPVSRRDITATAPTLTRQTAGQLPAPAVVAVDPQVTEPATSIEEPKPDIAPEPLPDPVAVADEDPADAAKVEIGDEVVGMDAKLVYSDLGLVDRAIAEFARQSAVLIRRRNAINEKVADIGRRSAVLSKIRVPLEKAAGPKPTGVQDYLKRAKEARAARSRRARKFIEAQTSEGDVAAQLNPKSKIDQALSSRPKPDQRRPQRLPMKQ